MAEVIPPDLQATVACEDVRTEISGQQTLIGVFGMIPAHALPVGFFKLCLWTRWCGGTGEFIEKSLILGCDDEQTIAQSELKFTYPHWILMLRTSTCSAACSFSTMGFIMWRFVSMMSLDYDIRCR